MAKQDEDRVDRASEESFPASDPPSSSGITGPRAVRPAQRKRSHERGEDARPKGTPTDERHATETAYHSEDEPHGRGN